VFGGLTLKPGRQKEYFLNVVKKHFPDQYDLLTRIYSKNDKYGRPDHTQKPVSVMIRGHRVCKEAGIRDRSIRHKMPGEFDSNNRVLGVVLDIVFYQVYALGRPWSKSRRYHELATTLEQGVGELTRLRKEGVLEERLHVDAEMASAVDDILDRGTCQDLEEIETTLSSNESGGGQVFTAWDKVN
jgi:hypothetical protein